MNVPPGRPGKMALYGLMDELDPGHAPRVFNLLQSSKDFLGERLVSPTTEFLFRNWAGEEFEKSWSFVSNLGSEFESEKANWMGETLWKTSPEDAQQLIRSIEINKLRSEVATTGAAINAYLETQNYDELYTTLADKIEDPTVHVTFFNRLRENGDFQSALNELALSEVAGKNELLIPSIKFWIKDDPVGGLEFLSSLDNSVTKSQAIYTSFRHIVEADPNSAKEWAELILEPKLKNQALKLIKSK